MESESKQGRTSIIHEKEWGLACSCYLELTKISPELGAALFKDANKVGGENEFMKILLKTIIKAKDL